MDLVKLFNEVGRSGDSGLLIFCRFEEIFTMIKCFSHPLSLMVFIVEAINDEGLLQEWFKITSDDTHLRNLQMYVNSIENDTFLTYFPFNTQDNGTFGILKQVSESFDNGQIIQTKINDLKQHPLSLELFESTFSILMPHHDTINFVGVDVNIGQTLAQKMNFSIQLFPRDGFYFGNLLPNGSFTGAIGRVSRRETNFGITGFFIKDYWTRALEFSAPIYSDQLCVVVRKAARVHPAEIPLRIFDTELWITCIISMAISAIFLVVLRKTNILQGKLPLKSKPLVNVFMDAVKGFLSVPLSDFPALTNERLFSCFLYITSVVIVSMFQSNLANFYIKPLYYKDINTLDQLDAHVNKIIVKHRAILDDAFPANVSQTMTHLKAKLYLNATIDPVQFMIDLGHVSSYKNLAGITRRANTFIDEALYYRLEQLHLVEECPRSYNLGFILPKHSYLNERINDILLRIVNAGSYFASSMFCLKM